MMAAIDPIAIKAEVIDPLLIASLESRAFFKSLPPLARALVVLDCLSTQTLRNGAPYFVEDDPRWITEAVHQACARLEEPALSRLYAALEPSIELVGERLRVRWEEAAEASQVLSRYVGDDRLGDRLAARAQAELERLAPHVERARGELEALRRARAQTEAERAASERARFEAARPGARSWTLHTRFTAGEFLVHATFGLGEVVAVQAHKIDVRFVDGTRRTLAHARPRRR